MIYEHPSNDKNVRRPMPGDIDHIAVNMRNIDRKELFAFDHNIGPMQALEDSVALSSQCWTAVDDTGAPVAMFGVAKDKAFYRKSSRKSTYTPVWLLATNAIYDTRNAIRFLRHSQAWTSWLVEQVGPIGNEVWGLNLRSLDWLSWLGFYAAKSRTIERQQFILMIKDV